MTGAMRKNSDYISFTGKLETNGLSWLLIWKVEQIIVLKITFILNLEKV